MELRRSAIQLSKTGSIEIAMNVLVHMPPRSMVTDSFQLRINIPPLQIISDLGVKWDKFSASIVNRRIEIVKNLNQLVKQCLPNHFSGTLHPSALQCFQYPLTPYWRTIRFPR